MDFTFQLYIHLLKTLKTQGFSFQTYSQFIELLQEKIIVLRHDVDRLPYNSLKTAELEHKLDIKGSYYFRSVPESFNEKVIKEIASLGHEIGYHYESLSIFNGNAEKAFDDFKKNLNKFRSLAPVTSICMHGSPRSKWDNRELWKTFDYKSLGIIGEPYFDIDFSKVFYLTDTGRCWDGHKYSIRDKVDTSFNLSFHSTFQIISAAQKGILPHQIMLTIHPQRWSDNLFPWIKEYIFQNIKNQVKLLKART
jgi:hypothetical protein